MTKKGKYGKIILDRKERDFIRKNWQTKTAKDIADHLGLKRTRVRMFAYEMGCRKMVPEYWTEEQVQFLKNNYQQLGDVELAEIFDFRWHKDKGWTKKHIEKKRRQLELKRTKEEIKKIKERNIEMGRFSECSSKMWKVRGITPPGTIKVWKMENGHIVKVIRTKTGFEHYNRWLWKKHHGKIPKKMIVRTKNDESLDIRIENLELIDRAENARRNSIFRYPKPLRETVKMKRKLEKLLNEKSS